MPRRPRAARGFAPLELGDLCQVRAHGLRVAQVARRREVTDEPAAAAALLLGASGREDAADPAACKDELVGRTVGERVHLVRVRVRVRVRANSNPNPNPKPRSPGPPPTPASPPPASNNIKSETTTARDVVRVSRRARVYGGVDGVGGVACLLDTEYATLVLREARHLVRIRVRVRVRLGLGVRPNPYPCALESGSRVRVRVRIRVRVTTSIV